MPTPRYARSQFYILTSQLKEIQDRADTTGASMSEIIRRLLQKALAS
ncbi:ribbon-helix-helix protein, CopG family [Tunturiibacter gelidiferens]